MGAKNAIRTQERLIRELQRTRKDARKAEACLRSTSSDYVRIAEQYQRACESLASILILIEEAVALLPASVGSGATLGDGDMLVSMRDTNRRLEQLLLAQRRTNELLELALGAAFDAET